MLNEEVLKIVLNDKSVGRDEAADIVGGLARLRRLVDSGQIRMTRQSSAQNAKWFCNLYDVISHAYSPYFDQ